MKLNLHIEYLYDNMFFEDSQKSTSLLCVLNGQGRLSGPLGGVRINLKDLKVEKI